MPTPEERAREWHDKEASCCDSCQAACPHAAREIYGYLAGWRERGENAVAALKPLVESGELSAVYPDRDDDIAHLQAIEEAIRKAGGEA